ncbi:MAG: acyl-CoA dehydrogenase family protein [Paracoccaceae bacterium]
MPYAAPARELSFLLRHVAGIERIAATDRFAEATPETVEAVLTEGARLCDDVIAPLQRPGDLNPARLENGIVRTSPGFDAGWRAIAEGGWIGICAEPEHGGMGLPVALATALNDMMAGACLSLQLAPLMTQGQIEALEHHASPTLQALYLPKLISGEWMGTMNLTEPQAGSDVGALRATAEPRGDGTWSVTGQKIYISWADNDFTENVCHLVLARTPGAPKGTKGISLFLVPKLIPDAQGRPGARNELKVVSLEHKMGLHGSPTAVMQYDGAQGWMVGDKMGGMAAMFTMMNNARVGVGVQGVGAAEGALQHATAYAADRKQGRAAGSGAIVEHADVRRMLAAMRADVTAARSIALMCAAAIDLGTAGDGAMKARAALLTPIAKAFGTDVGIEVADRGIQVHGGMGFVEETGAAQYARDVRVTAIYEGTNGIQAMDLVGRKLSDGGAAAFALLDEVEAAATDHELAAPVAEAARALRAATEDLLGRDMEARGAAAVPYLRAFARVLGAHAHLICARAEPGGARERLARFYVNRLLPEHAALLAQAGAGMDVTAADLVA